MARPFGSSNKRTEETIEKAKDTGLLPLDIMLSNARWAEEEARAAEARVKAAAEAKGDFADPKALDAAKRDLHTMRKMAQDFSSDAAPYIHSKLSSVDQKLSGTVTLEQLVTESFAQPAQPTAPQPQTVKH